MRKSLLILFFVSVVFCSFVSAAIVILTPANNSNLTGVLNLTWNNTNISTPGVYSIALYNSSHVSAGVLVNESSFSAYGQWNTTAKYANRCYDGSSHMGGLYSLPLNNVTLMNVTLEFKSAFGGTNSGALIDYVYTDGGTNSSSCYETSSTSFSNTTLENPFPSRPVALVNVYGVISNSYGGTDPMSVKNILVNPLLGQPYISGFYNYIYNLNLDNRSYYVNVSYLNSSLSVLSSAEILLNVVTNSLLNVTAVNGSNLVTSFSLNITDLSNNVSSTYGTSNGFVATDVSKGHSYNIFIDAPGFSYTSTNVSIVNSSHVVNFSLVPANSVNISIFDEANGLLINSSNTSISFVSPAYSYAYSTTTGRLFVSGLNPDNYTVLFSNPSYSVRSYAITIPTRSTQNLSAFLNNGTAVLLNFKTASGAVLSGVYVSMRSYVNGTLQVVESHYSDITGRAQFSVRSNVYYDFNSSLSGYGTYFFFLNPVLFSSYDIVMTGLSSGQTIPSATVVYSPTIFFGGQSTNFNISFASQFGSLSGYYYNITFPNSSYAGNGANAYGSSFANAFNISTSPDTRYVTLYYEYTLSNGAYQNWTYTYRIVPTANNHTVMTFGQQTYGYQIGDRIVIAAIIILVLVGAVWIGTGSIIAGLVMGGLYYGIFIANSFIPKEIGYIMAVIIIIIIMGRGSSG